MRKVITSRYILFVINTRVLRSFLSVYRISREELTFAYLRVHVLRLLRSISSDSLKIRMTGYENDFFQRARLVNVWKTSSIINSPNRGDQQPICRNVLIVAAAKLEPLVQVARCGSKTRQRKIRTPHTYTIHTSTYNRLLEYYVKRGKYIYKFVELDKQ